MRLLIVVCCSFWSFMFLLLIYVGFVRVVTFDRLDWLYVLGLMCLCRVCVCY